MSVRILLVDDHKIVREGLKVLLEKEPGFQVVAEAEDGHAAVRIAGEINPDIVIMDVAMPNCNGIEAATKIRAAAPKTKVVALTMHSDKNYLTGMLHAGTSGYLLKDCAAEELIQAVHEVMAGNGYISPEIAPLIIQDYVSKSHGTADTAPDISLRERQILQYLAGGLNSREIAERLQVCTKTVDRARAQLMEKLKIYNVAELTKFAIRKGFSSLT